MEVSGIIKEIDSQIAKLQQARALLGEASPVPEVKRRGRPRKVEQVATPKRQMSPEARKRIADAQKKRWAAQKKGK